MDVTSKVMDQVMFNQKLNSVELDVKIILKDGKNTVTRMYNSNVMSFFSGYIDERIENQNTEIIFPDVDVETWDLCTRFLDPSEARNMTEEDVFVVAPVYHKYEFKQGLALCALVLEDYFNKIKKDPFYICGFLSRFDTSRFDMRVFVETIMIHFNFNLEMNDEMQAFMEEALTSQTNKHKKLLFTRDHIKTLQPWIVHLAEQNDHFRKTLNPSSDAAYDMETIQSIVFSDLYVSDWRCLRLQTQLEDKNTELEDKNSELKDKHTKLLKMVSQIHLSGAGDDFDGVYIRTKGTNDFVQSGVGSILEVTKPDRRYWVIRNKSRVFFRSQKRTAGPFNPVPPKFGYESLRPRTVPPKQTEVKIGYEFSDGVEW